MIYLEKQFLRFGFEGRAYEYLVLRGLHRRCTICNHHRGVPCTYQKIEIMQGVTLEYTKTRSAVTCSPNYSVSSFHFSDFCSDFVLSFVV